jgi:hypothetical protein
MVVSPFDRLRSARSQIVEKCRYSTAKPIIAQNTNLVAENIAVPRTRGSVRRASGFVQIPITLKARSVLLLSITAPKRLNIPNCSCVSLTRDYAKWVNGRQDRLDKLVRDYCD